MLYLYDKYFFFIKLLSLSKNGYNKKIRSELLQKTYMNPKKNIKTFNIYLVVCNCIFLQFCFIDFKPYIH